LEILDDGAKILFPNGRVGFFFYCRVEWKFLMTMLSFPFIMVGLDSLIVGLKLGIPDDRVKISFSNGKVEFPDCRVKIILGIIA